MSRPSKSLLERTPPELSADLVDKGIILTGGGSLLKNLDIRLREETNLPVSIAEEPLLSVGHGEWAKCCPIRTFSNGSVGKS